MSKAVSAHSAPIRRMRSTTLIALGAASAIFSLVPLTATPMPVVPTPTTESTTNWLNYNNDYKGQRYSSLKEITSSNVASLEEHCRVTLADGGSLHTGPVIADGVMYVTTTDDTFAIDPTNCAVIWKSHYQAEDTKVFPANRGVALMNGRVFRGTTDGRLLALDAQSGKLIWKNVVGDPSLNEFVVGAPLAWNGLVIVGTAGSDFGIKGRIAAYDAMSGREIWRFVTIPTGTETGAETWDDKQAAETGGGGSWSTITLDVINGEVFVPVGNPAPSFDPRYRPGANLFTNSVVVLDALTGRLKWWYQLVANDGHDLDLAAAPLLYTNSDGRDMVAAAGKDGYLHSVDRLTHKVAFKTAVTTIENEGVPPGEKELRFCPGGAGGTQWNGPSFSPPLRTLFVGAVDWCSLVRSTNQKRYPKSTGVMMFGATAVMDTEHPGTGWIHAVDSESGAVKWKFHASAPIVAGVTATAGGIVLTGDTAGHFLALDSRSGKLLLDMDLHGAIAGGVVSYAISGRQYIAVTAGNVSRSVFGAVGKPSIVIMQLNPEARKALRRRAAANDNGAGELQDNADADRGGKLFADNCSACHGPTGEGGTGKSLRGIATRLPFGAILDKIKNPIAPMPKLYPNPLSEQAVADMAAFIQTLQ